MTKMTAAAMAIIAATFASGCESDRANDSQKAPLGAFPAPTWGSMSLPTTIVNASGPMFEDVHRAWLVASATSWDRSLFADTSGWQKWTGNWPGWAVPVREWPGLALSPADDSAAHARTDGDGTLVRTWKLSANYQFWKISYLDSQETAHLVIEASATTDGKRGWVSFVPQHDSGYYEWEWWFEEGQQVFSMIWDGRLHTANDTTLAARIRFSQQLDGPSQISFNYARQPDLWRVDWSDSTATGGAWYCFDPQAESWDEGIWDDTTQARWRTSWDDNLDPAWYELNDDWRTVLGL